MEVEVGLKKLIVNHLEGRLPFIHPPVRGSIGELEMQLIHLSIINKVHLKLPTFSEKVSLDYDSYMSYVYDDGNEYSKEIREWNKSGLGYTRTGVLWGKDGMYVVDLDCALDLNEVEIKKLEERLNGKKLKGVQLSKDKKVAFVPYDKIIYGHQKHRDLAKNRGLIALTRDLVQAEMVADMSRYYKIQPRFRGEEKFTGKVLKGYATLGSYPLLGHLCVESNVSGNVEGGVAFSVLKETSKENQ